MSPQLIKFTHIVNPHLFWFTHENQTNDDFSVKIENALTSYVKQNGDAIKGDCNPNCRSQQVVAVYSMSMKKWIRAEIDEVASPNTHDLIVWATDYGIPISTSLDLVAELSVDLRRLCIETPSSVHKGGLFGYFPARYTLKGYGFVRDEWDSAAVETLEKIKPNSGISVLFKKKFEHNNHEFGELTIEKGDKSLDVGNLFENSKWAISKPRPRFERDIIDNNIIKMARWCGNDGKIACIKNQSFEESSMPSPSCSESISYNGTASDPMTSEPMEEIDQHKIQSKLSRSLISKATSEEKTQTPVKQAANSVTSDTQSISRRRLDILKKYRDTKTQQQSAKTYELPNRRVDLKELNEAKLANKVKLIPILLRNNDEEPIEAIQAAVFTKQVHRGMKKMNFQETYLNQAYAWPNLLRGNSMVLVDSQNKGKTIAYLPALCSIVQKTFEQTEKTMMGATAIIVTSNVAPIAEMCRTLLQLPAIVCNVVEAIGTRDATNVIIKLYNGCNILVATAPCLAKLIKGSPNAIKSDKLKCIAFENIDCNMEKYKTEIDYIVNELCLRKSYKGDQRQIMVTSRTWRSSLLKFMNEKLISDSVLLIGNYLEAAMFAGVTLNFNLCQNEIKCEQLTEYIKSIPYGSERTLVVCNEADETEQVAKHFEEKNIPYELVKEIESSYAKAKVKSSWENKSGILICTDSHLASIFIDSQLTQIQNAQHILHFSLPTQDFRKFLHRFVVMLDFYKQCDADSGTSDKPKATSTIFIDNDNVQQLPKLVDLLTRDGQEIPLDLFTISQAARKWKIKEKAERLRFESICNMLFMHGTNEHQANCEYRHLLLPSDLMEDSSLQPTSGYLRFNLLKCISPTEYIVQPTYHSTGYGDKYQIFNGSDQFESLDEEFQSYYKNEHNQQVLGALELGQKCVILVRGKYFRAQIIRIFEKRSITDVDKYKVRLLDTGEVEVLNAFDLYTLAEPFRALPNQAVHLHLTGVIPADQEDDWDSRVCTAIQNHLLVLNEFDSIFEANIVFSLRNTFVVDIMRIVNSQGVVICSIKKFLNNKSYGILSNDSRKKVFEMAKIQGIKIAKPQKTTEKQTVSSDTKLEPPSSPKNTKNGQSYARTSSPNEQNNDMIISRDDLDSENSAVKEESNEKWQCPWKWQHNQITISQFYNTNHFYITQKSDQIIQLYEAIGKYVAEKIKPSMDESMEQPDVHKYCLVNIDENFHRAKVLDIIYNNESAIVAITMEVLLVDTGLIQTVAIEDVYDIPDDLVQRFPFQAIWCNMIGIKAIANEDVQDFNDIIYQICDNIDEYGDELFLHVVSTDRNIKSKIPYTHIPRHDVILLAVNENRQINLNEMLVKMNLTEFDAATECKLDNVPNVLEEENDSDSESDWDNDADVSNKWRMNDENFDEIAVNKTDDTEYMKFLEEYPEDEFKQFALDLLNANQMLDQIQNAVPEKKHTIEPIIEENEVSDIENDDEITLDNITEDSTERSEEGEEDPNDRPILEYIYKRPQVIWWQDEESIVLKISAHDNVKYGLEVTSNSLYYVLNENDEQMVAVINFFGYVDFEKTSHQIRGLNVVVRLRKECPIMWPRLLLSAEKCNWLTNNVDAVKDEPLYEQAMHQFVKYTDTFDNIEDTEELSQAQLFELEDDIRTCDDSSEDS